VRNLGVTAASFLVAFLLVPTFLGTLSLVENSRVGVVVALGIAAIPRAMIAGAVVGWLIRSEYPLRWAAVVGVALGVPAFVLSVRSTLLVTAEAGHAFPTLGRTLEVVSILGLEGLRLAVGASGALLGAAAASYLRARSQRADA
jgi:hypothetical protein